MRQLSDTILIIQLADNDDYSEIEFFSSIDREYRARVISFSNEKKESSSFHQL